jgi:hypothetical protein
MVTPRWVRGGYRLISHFSTLLRLSKRTPRSEMHHADTASRRAGRKAKTWCGKSKMVTPRGGSLAEVPTADRPADNECRKNDQFYWKPPNEP